MRNLSEVRAERLLSWGHPLGFPNTGGLPRAGNAALSGPRWGARDVLPVAAAAPWVLFGMRGSPFKFHSPRLPLVCFVHCWFFCSKCNNVWGWGRPRCSRDPGLWMPGAEALGCGAGQARASQTEAKEPRRWRRGGVTGQCPGEPGSQSARPPSFCRLGAGTES